MPRPAMSGAEPWIGSYNPGPPSPIEAEGIMPSEPVNAAVSSVRMSPKRFSVSTTSKSRGRAIRYIAIASTSRCSTATSGYSRAMSAETVSRQRREVSSTLALSTETSRRWRARASAAAVRVTRWISSTVYAHSSVARSAVRVRAPK